MSLARRLLEHFVRPAGGPWPAGPEAPDNDSPPAVSGREAAAGAVAGREAAAGAVAGRKPRGAQRRDGGRRREAPGRELAATGHGAPGRNTDRGDPPPGPPVAIAVLAALADAAVIGSALGLAVARRDRAPVAAVCVWTPRAVDLAVWGAPSWPAARRLASALAARGLDARAAGRLAQVRLDADCEAAARQARRVIAAAGDAPAVLALGGPRSASFEELLAQQDLVVVALRGATNPALAHLALDGLQRALPRAPCACDVPASGIGRVLASAGLALHPALRRALAPAIEALR